MRSSSQPSVGAGLVLFWALVLLMLMLSAIGR